MKRLTALGASLLTYFCVATVLALFIAVAALWLKGALDPGRLYRVLAALHGIDVVTMQQQLAAQQEVVHSEQPSHQMRLEKEKLASLDLDLRETAVNKGLQDLAGIQMQLVAQQTKFEEMQKTYADKLKQLAEQEQSAALQELQTTLSAMKPTQAKDQIMKMLEDNAIDDVVSILRSMPMDKRKKLLAEFKLGPEVEALYEILKNIRLGEPLASEIQESQRQLNAFNELK
jgi:flagellar motility protein MotE (MotC chaperone)